MTRIIITGLVLLLSSGCFPNLAGDTHIKTVKRLCSPSGKVDAVLELVAGGATVGSGYVVLVGPVGFDPSSNSTRNDFIMGSFSRVKDAGVDLEWTSSNQLSVSCVEFGDLYQNRLSQAVGEETFSIKWIKR
jgi:hypothetical protein